MRPVIDHVFWISMRKASLLGVLVPLVLIAGCGKGNFNSHSAEGKPGVFRYAIVNRPTTMDPGKVQDGDTIDVIQQVYEGLVGWSDKNEVEPRLAEKWDVTNGGLTYVFHLRPGVKFTSGRELTAQDFKDCIERNCIKTVNSETVSTYLTDIVGVKEMIDGTAKSIEGIKVVDPKTLSITIDKPRPYFLGKLTYPAAFVFDLKALPDKGKEITDIKQMIGTGPFKFDKVAVDTQVSMVANPDYWGGKPQLSRIERPYMPDPSTRLNAYKNGDLDLVQLEQADVSGLQKDPKYQDQVKLFDRASMFYVGFNLNMIPALKDRKVRQALAMAIDKDKIVNQTLGGLDKRADSIVPPGVFGYRDKVNGLPYDVAKAKQLLAEAGFPDGKGFPKLEMSFRNNRPDIRLVAEAVGAEWDKNLGIKTTFRPLEWATYLDIHNKKQMPLFHMRWGADYLDAENFLSTLLASYGNENKISYANPQYDALCRQADTSEDPELRKKLYGQAEDIALQDAPFVPLYFQRDAELIRPTVKGIRDSLFGHLPHVKTSTGS